MSDRPHSEIVHQALEMALRARRSQAPLIHHLERRLMAWGERFDDVHGVGGLVAGPPPQSLPLEHPVGALPAGSGAVDAASAGHGAAAVCDAIAASIVTLPEQLRRSLAWDQGAEMAEHVQLRVDTGLAIYFCDPQSPWQRGTNENTNGLLRQYFPKGTDLNKHSADDLTAVAATLNGRPRKTLRWKTPTEAFNELILSGQPAIVATTP